MSEVGSRAGARRELKYRGGAGIHEGTMGTLGTQGCTGVHRGITICKTGVRFFGAVSSLFRLEPI